MYIDIHYLPSVIIGGPRMYTIFTKTSLISISDKTMNSERKEVPYINRKPCISMGDADRLRTREKRNLVFVSFNVSEVKKIALRAKMY